MIAPATTVLAAAVPQESFMAQTHWQLVARIGVAWVLTFSLGFERQLRGAMAGDRTFSLLGASTALIGVMSAYGSPTILAGAVTGIGFIGGGLCFRQTVQTHEVLQGVTTAASVFCAAAVGAACGLGLVKEAAVTTCATLLTLELRHIPGLRALDARRWTGRVKHDDHLSHHWLHHPGGTLIPAQAGTRGSAPPDPAEATAETADTDRVVLLPQ